MASKDHWTAQKYDAAASFVPQLTSTVLSYLDAQPGDRILDIGCGNGPLTAQIAQAVAPEGKVLGLDGSASFIASAGERYTTANLTFGHQDGTRLGERADTTDGRWDKVFSNAALHWVLRAEATRVTVFKDVFRALRSGGKLVFEMGGKGNVAEVQVAFMAALVHAGVSIEAAREASPWFFPTVGWMEETLRQAGFEVEKCELEYRPTKMNAETADGSGGLQGWARLMGANYLDAVEDGKREAVLKEVLELLDSVETRDEDGSKWIGNVRLRAVARKP